MQAATPLGGVDLWDLLPQHVQHDVLSRMSLVTAIKLALASKECYSLYKDHCASRVNRQLTNFDMPVTETLSIMRSRGISLSGSVAMLILEGDIFDPGDMDLFVPNGSMEEVHKFIIGNTLYTQTGQETPQWPRPIQGAPMNYDTSQETGIVQVRLYAHKTSGRSINIVETTLNVSSSAVMLFHSTSVMNFVTWNAIVSAYPLKTSNRKSLLNSYRRQGQETPRVEKCLRKYEDRGFETSNSCDQWSTGHSHRLHGYCGHIVRKISDSTTMRVCFTEWSNVHADVLDEGLQWRLACNNDCRDSSKYKTFAGRVVTSSGSRVDKYAGSAPPSADD